MPSPLESKAIVIIGGTAGLGLSAARALLGAGAKIVAVGRDDPSADEARKTLESLAPGRTRVTVGDATDPVTSTQAVADCLDAFGSFDGLYHVAGGSGRSFGDGPVHELTDEGIGKTLDLNLKSVIYSNRAATQAFLERETPGAVLNVGSVLGTSPSPGFFSTHVYAAAKAAIVGFTQSAAAYYAPRNIRFNVIAPALVDTPMARRAAENEAIMTFIEKKQPLDGGRIGRAEDLDDLVVYLLSNQSRFVTGQVIAVDGGWSVSDGAGSSGVLSPSFHAAIERTTTLKDPGGNLRALLGFDGTVDLIYRAVEQRTDIGDAYQPFRTVGDFGRRIVNADNENALIEIVPNLQKIGGNGTLLANALSIAGVSVDYIGPLGAPTLHPAYASFAERVQVHSIGEPAVTNALEFENGKVMLSTLSNYEPLTPENVQEAVPKDRLTALIEPARLVGLFNWACVPAYEDLLDWLVQEILPGAPSEDRIYFFDLTDPSRRTDEDIHRVLTKMAAFRGFGAPVLGLNLNETRCVCRALGLDEPGSDTESVLRAASAIREELNLHLVLSHSFAFAVCVSATETGFAEGLHTDSPAITTGAGDHLNAGFCLGLLLKAPLEEALHLGILYAGFYVRNARPPEPDELSTFLEGVSK